MVRFKSMAPCFVRMVCLIAVCGLLPLAPLAASGRVEEDPPETVRNTWVLSITQFDLSMLSPGRRIVGEVITRSLLEYLDTVSYRLRLCPEIAFYEGYEWRRSVQAAAQALARRQNDRSLLIFRGDPNWRFQRELRRIDEDIERLQEAERPTLFFIEGIPHGENPSWGTDDPQNTVNAFHHYDGITLFTKRFKPWVTIDRNTGRIILGCRKTAAHFSKQLAREKAWTQDRMGDMPCLLGEFGLPFDLNNKKAYKTGDYRQHERALSLYYDGIDENLLSSTIWNYTADNNNLEGDHWNGEDLSIVSSPVAGSPLEARAMGGWLRPYPMATAGIPLKFNWCREKAAFCFRFRADPCIQVPTEIFVPSQWFPGDLSVSITAGEGGGALRAVHVREQQRLFVYNDGYAGEAELYITLLS